MYVSIVIPFTKCPKCHVVGVIEHVDFSKKFFSLSTFNILSCLFMT